MEALAQAHKEEARRRADGVDDSEEEEEAGSSSSSWAHLYAADAQSARPTSGSASRSQPSITITIPGKAAAAASGRAPLSVAGTGDFAGAGGSGAGSYSSGYGGLSPSAAAGAAAQPSAGRGGGANGSLRVAASEFCPQPAPPAAERPQQDPSSDPLVTKFLSGQLIATSETVSEQAGVRLTGRPPAWQDACQTHAHARGAPGRGVVEGMLLVLC